MIADGRCPVEAQKYAPDTWALPKGVALFYYTPTKESWATGDRAVSCTYTVEKGTFTGSLDTAKALKPEQITYLKGSNAVYDAVGEPAREGRRRGRPGRLQGAGQGCRRRPRRTRQGSGRRQGRRGRQAPRDADEGGRQLEEGRERRRRRRVLHRLRPGVHRHRPSKSVAARKELGLATTVPADEAEVWAS